VPIDELPDHLIKAVLATEDRRFFSHFGIDFIGLARAMNENASRRRRRAGRFHADPAAGQATCSSPTSARSSARSRRPSSRSGWNGTYSKKEILKLYLDRAYMGGGTFGAAAAAQFYFGKNVTDVNLAEAAMLAGLFKAPGRYAPHINLPAARGAPTWC
jgi:penicillin-binding protein 1A